MTPKELDIYTMGWNMGLTAAAGALRSGGLRKDVTREDLAAHLELMLVKTHDDPSPSGNTAEGK